MDDHVQRAAAGGSVPFDRTSERGVATILSGPAGGVTSEIDAEAWESMYSTVSRPLDKPETGKIAVKVINDHGDEVMKVFEV